VAKDGFDVAVVGSGPAGSIAALRLARRGARVAVIDRVRFPRDKACGDLLSPRTLEVLQEEDIGVLRARQVGAMRMIGPGGRSMALPWPSSVEFPDHAAAIPRSDFDEQLRQAALGAGAEFLQKDVVGVDARSADATLRFATGRLSVPFVIGADGSLSRVAEASGLRGAGQTLWGFALRYYVEAEVAEPLIVYWEPDRRKAFPGYGWVFPSADGRANLGLGVSTGFSRRGGETVNHSMEAFIARLHGWGLLESVALRVEERRGGWLKMGLTGNRAASGPILLVGDAAGVVSPLAGEGISGALVSARAAADAIIDHPGDAGATYQRRLRDGFLAYHSSTAPVQAFMVRHPRIFSLTVKALTVPPISRLVGASWSMYWNDLRDGAVPGIDHFGADAIAAVADLITRRSGLRRAIGSNLE
jgi:geranylgeranyl reductase family protein